MQLLPVAACLAFALTSAVGSAATLSFTGALDPTNPNDIALIPFTVATAGGLIIQSYGYGGTSDAPGGTNAAETVIAAGGFDSYLSLFVGTGPGATFLAANDDGPCGPAQPDPVCEDAQLAFSSIAAGSYTLAVSLPNNFSFAENYGSGTLGDGFIGLQGDFYDVASGSIRTPMYAVDITTAPKSFTVAPEPQTFNLLVTGLLTPAVTAFSLRRAKHALHFRRAPQPLHSEVSSC